jgi:hypothetical protein
MTQLLPLSASLLRKSSIFQNARAFGPEVENLLEHQRSAVFTTGARKVDWANLNRLIVGESNSANVVRSSPLQSIDATIFNSLVELKVGVAQYAMHLSPEIRAKIFSDLDEIINVEDWYEEDALPRFSSFRDFLKWTIYSKRFNWTSIGISDEGNILVAWKSTKALLTARYDGEGRVWWTATIYSDEENNFAAGDCSLEFFEREAHHYLD